LGFLAPQTLGYGVGAIIEFPHRLVNPGTKLLAHETGFIDHVGNSGGGRPCFVRDLFYSSDFRSPS